MITKAKIKGALLQFKRAPFTCQKGMFCNAKGHLLRVKRACFAMQKGIFYNAKEHLLIYRCEFILH